MLGHFRQLGMLMGMLLLSASAACGQGGSTSKPTAVTARLDQHGDPLPPGAIARIGSTRLRQLEPMQVLFARDGKTLFSVSGEGKLVQWDVASGRALRSVEKRFSVVLSPDGRTLAATGPAADAVSLLDAATLELKRTLTGEPGAGVSGVAFAPDGQQLAFSSGGGRTVIWELATGRKVGKLPYAGWRLAFSRDGRWLAGTGGRVVDTGTLKYGDWHHGRAFALSPTEDRLAAGDTDGKTIASGCQTGSIVGAGSKDPAIRLWDAATGRELRRLPVNKRGVRSLAFSADGRMLAAAVEPCSIILWDTDSGRLLHAAPEYVTAVAFAPDSRLLAVCGDKVTLHASVSGKEEFCLNDGFGGRALASSITFAADGRRLAAANGAAVHIWDVPTRKPLRELHAAPGNDKHYQVVAFAPDGKVVATAGVGRVCLFAVDHGQKLHELEGGFGSTLSNAVAFAPDGRQLATGHVANRVLLWDPRAGKYLQQIGETSKEVTHAVNGLAFFPDGKTLASAGDFYGHTLHLYDTASGRLRRRPLTGHTRWIAAVALAPDGKSLASAGWDSTVRLWEVATGRQRAVLTGPPGIVGAVAVAADGRHIASAHQDGTALVWDICAGLPDKHALTPDALDSLWADLGDEDAAKGFRAICTLTRAPVQALPFLKERVKPTMQGPAVIQALLVDLGDKRFAVRDRATKELERFGEMAEPALEAALEGQLDLETRRRAEQILARVREKGAPTIPDWLRANRVVEAAWRIGTLEARELLELWAREEGTWHGAESRAVLAALRRP